MAVSRAAVIEEARRWIGTPFQHQCRERGVATDCGGLIGGVAVAVGLVPPTWWRDWFDPRFSGYARRPSNGVLEALCDELMVRRSANDEPQPGDALLMRFAREPQHLGIIVPYKHGGRALVHALSTAGKVCEHRLGPAWLRCVVSAYRLPGVA